MSRRTVVVAVVAVVAGYGASARRGESADPAARPVPALRAGFVNVVQVMKGYKTWQAKAGEMSAKRAEATGRIGKLREEHAAKQKSAETAAGDSKDELARQVVVLSRQIEDADRDARRRLDAESGAILRSLYGEIEVGVRGLARERQLDAVFFYPARPGQGELADPPPQIGMDLMLRPQAMIPFYLRDELDLTNDLLARLNAGAPPAAK